MRAPASILGFLAACAAGNAATAQSAPAPVAASTDQGDRIPPALIGAWKLSPSESRFPQGRAPKMQYRIFDRSVDGMLLGHYLAVAADGTLTSGNWTSPLDGSWRPEYLRTAGPAPYAMVQYTRRDAFTIDQKATKRGVLFETGLFVLSPDGKTLSVTFTVGGVTSFAVYHPWNLMN